MNSKSVKIIEDYVLFNNKKIKYFIIKKKVKNISIRIKNDKNIYITSPYNISNKKIKQLVLDKFFWINKNLSKIENNKFECESKLFKENEFIYFLGKKYIIKIVEKNYLEKENKNLFFDDNKIVFNVSNKYLYNSKYIEKMFNNFIYEFSFNLYRNICNKYINDIFFKYIDKDKFDLKIRKMKSKWGVCYPFKNRVTINFYAIKLPLNCIEYIILHELSHFIYHNHSKDFYNFIEKYMKDYKIRNKIINEDYRYII